MARFATIALAPLHFEDRELRSAALGGNGSDHLCARNQRCSDLRAVFGAHQQDLAELYAVPNGSLEFLYAEGFPGLYPKLLPSRPNDGVHHGSSTFAGGGSIGVSGSKSSISTAAA